MLAAWLFTNEPEPQIWNDLYQVYTDESADYFPGGISQIDVNETSGLNLAEDLRITHYPTLIFFLDDGQGVLRSITRIEGDTNGQQIYEVLSLIFDNWDEVTSATGTGSNGDVLGVQDGTGIILTEDGSENGSEDGTGNGYGLGIDWLNFPWLAITAFASYKAATAKNAAGTALWGTAATAAGIKAFQD